MPPVHAAASVAETVLFYSAGPYGPLGRQLATRAAHELCRNATAVEAEWSLARMAASWRASSEALVLNVARCRHEVAEGSHAGAASSIAPTDAARVEVALQRDAIRAAARRPLSRPWRRLESARAEHMATPLPLGAREDAVARAGRHARSAGQSASLRSARAHDLA